MTSPTLDQKIAYALRDDPEAIAFFFLMRDTLHFWDDLIDKDQPLLNGDLNKAMFNALVTLPRNAFYRKHFDALNPVLVNAIGNWQAANVFEVGDTVRQLQVAFVIRSDYANLLIHSAFLLGGYDWMIHVTPLIRDAWTGEDFDAYLVNRDIERVARQGAMPYPPLQEN